jgi:hypothetical protein
MMTMMMMMVMCKGEGNLHFDHDNRVNFSIAMSHHVTKERIISAPRVFVKFSQWLNQQPFTSYGKLGLDYLTCLHSISCLVKKTQVLCPMNHWLYTMMSEPDFCHHSERVKWAWCLLHPRGMGHICTDRWIKARIDESGKPCTSSIHPLK